MRNRSEAQAAPSGNDILAGAGLATVGAALLASTLTRLWTAPAIVPAALAVALIVFGSYLLSLRAGLGARSRAG